MCRSSGSGEYIHSWTNSPNPIHPPTQLTTSMSDRPSSHSESQHSLPPPEYLAGSRWPSAHHHAGTRNSTEIEILPSHSSTEPPQAYRQQHSTTSSATVYHHTQAKPGSTQEPAYYHPRQPHPVLSPEPHSDHHSECDTDKEGQSYDDYDWDNDDDLEGDVRFTDLNENKDTHHRRRTLAHRFSPYSIIKFILTTFIGNILLSLLLIIPPLIYRFAGYYNSAESEFVSENVAAWMFWASYNILASWVLHFLIELIPRLTVLLVGVVWGDVNETIKSRVETFQTAKSWVKVTFYSAMAWGSWEVLFRGIYPLHSVMDNGEFRAPYTQTVHTVVELLFFFMLVLSIEKLLLLSISMSFHRVAYADRIEKVTRAFAVIDALKDYRPKRKSLPLQNQSRPQSSGMTNKRGASSPKTKNRWWSPNRETKPAETDQEKSGIDERQLGDRFNPTPNQTPKLQRRNSHSTFAALAQRGASAARIARAAMKDPISVVGKKSGLKLDINNPQEAKKLARKIYFGMKADANRTYLIPSDFYPAFPTHEVAKEAFAIFDSDGNGDISRTEVKNEIFRAYKERRALANSLQDVGHAIGRLDRIMMAMAGIVFIFIALSVVGVDYSKALTSVYTVGIAAAFIFKETAGNVFDAIIMVFCTHPYDTGDRVIMENEGVEEVLVVKQMGLLVTIFSRWDGTEWFAPNSLLGQKFIINLRRSSSQFENATVQFGWDTPLEKLDELEEKMNLWLQTDEQRRFEPGTACVIQHLVNQQYMEITIGMTHRENWQDWGGRWNRRTAFHAALNHYTKELGIKFYNSEQPIEFKNPDVLKEHLLGGGGHSILNDSQEEGDEEYEEGDEEYEEGKISSIRTRKPPHDNLSASLGLGDTFTTGLNPRFNQFASVFTRDDVKLPDALGFSPPPNSGTGMRKRKKISKKKAMLGDA